MNKLLLIVVFLSSIFLGNAQTYGMSLSSTALERLAYLEELAVTQQLTVGEQAELESLGSLQASLATAEERHVNELVAVLNPSLLMSGTADSDQLLGASTPAQLVALAAERVDQIGGGDEAGAAAASSEDDGSSDEDSSSSAAKAEPLGGKRPRAPEYFTSKGGKRPRTEGQLICPECGKKFNLKESFAGHMRRHATGKLNKCTDCAYECYSPADLIKHMRKHTGERPFKCAYPGCTKAYADKSNLRVHEWIHTDERPFKCTIPGCTNQRGFIDQSNLNAHKRTHTGDKPFKCTHPGCTYASTRKINLKRHQKNCRFGPGAEPKSGSKGRKRN